MRAADYAPPPPSTGGDRGSAPRRAPARPAFAPGPLGALAAALVLLASSVALAHKPSDSYLALTVEGAHVTGQWDVALRDLDHALGLDTDGDGAITWGELRRSRAAVESYALSRLAVSADGVPCAAPHADALLVDDHSDGGYAVLRFSLACPRAPATLDVRYSLFFDVDPQHRGLARVEYGGVARTAIFSPDSPVQRFDLASARAWAEARRFVVHGVWHIWTGFDHILFLLALLLPSVLRRKDGQWVPSPSLRATLTDVLKIVSTFTVAHSLTLSLAALGVVHLPSRLVESAIALSVLLAALNNVFPLVEGRRWLVAFAFGLLHGFGFATVLGDLGLSGGALVRALVSFNIGVELGQLVVVAAFLAVAFELRRTWAYRRVALQLGSVAIALLAATWLAERALALKLLPWT